MSSESRIFNWSCSEKSVSFILLTRLMCPFVCDIDFHTASFFFSCVECLCSCQQHKTDFWLKHRWCLLLLLSCSLNFLRPFARLNTLSYQLNHTSKMYKAALSSQTKWSTSFHQRVKFLWQSNRIQTALKVMMEQRKVMINHDKVVFFSERPNTLILQQCWEEAQLEQQSWTPRLQH